MNIIGVAAYIAIVRSIVIPLRNPAAPAGWVIRLAYWASAASAAVVGLMWSPEPMRRPSKNC